MNEKMLLSQDKRIIASIGISLICFIIGDVLGIVCLFSNPTLAKTIFGIVLFCPASFLLLLALVFMLYGGFQWSVDPEKGAKNGQKIIINASLASFVPGIFILLSDLTLLKVPFGIHLLFSYCFLLLLLFATQVYRARSAIPEEDTKARFIVFLENIVPIQFQEEWLGDLQEQHYQLIKDGTPLWKVYFITLLTGLGLIQSYLWLEFDKFVSRWITRAKKVFLG
ncbi:MULTISPECIES: hypothetical protein [unclassified Microcoleus]|uniref:hypothetical protein n=1 Tax=unclassified Microcoleus TaxID=2642155 RepID=UPI001D9BFA3D|nr:MULTISPECIES: hypothetical protein [unclassified Microcoleus]MCC3564892.1 hypothetical protein [Microcoleus sp. PH2017_31_RDM_U_A]MCC3578211.1 hypothetical protein [Microcoleus sp. PH2017_32_RDM_D_A]MCC3615214.1 hypothetical protein [Microcoleus sp. PH2017_38_RDM_U_B]